MEKETMEHFRDEQAELLEDLYCEVTNYIRRMFVILLLQIEEIKIET